MLRKTIKKIGALLFVFILSFSLFACAKEPEYTEDALLAATAQLLEKVAYVDAVFFGDGIAVTQKSTEKYQPCTEESLLMYGITTLEDLGNLAKSVYSPYMCEWIETHILTYNGDAGTPTYARYTEKEVEENGEKKSVLHAFVGYKQMTQGVTTYDFDTLKVVETAVDGATLSITMQVTKDGETIMAENQKFSVAYANGVFSLDSFVFMNVEA